jgi:hypothetical protein
MFISTHSPRESPGEPAVGASVVDVAPEVVVVVEEADVVELASTVVEVVFTMVVVVVTVWCLSRTSCHTATPAPARTMTAAAMPSHRPKRLVREGGAP